MSFTFLIVAVGARNELEIYVNLMKNLILETETHIKKLVHFRYIPCDLETLKKYLTLSCNIKKANMIIIIGENKNNESEIVSAATKSVISLDIHEKVTPFILDLENKLQKTIPQAVCGIQNNTLIFNIFGLCINVRIFWTTNKEDIFYLLKIVQNCAFTNYQSSACNTSNLSSEGSKNICIKAKEYKKLYTPIVTVSETINVISGVISENWNIESEYMNVREAYGRMLSQNIHSHNDVPSYRTSATDGYAIIVNDGKSKKKILEPETTFSLKPGTCVKVQPGAFIPDEATAVVIMKNIKIISKDDDNNTNIEKNEEEIEIIIEPKEGENIRPIGDQIKKGEKILNECTRIGPAEIGLLTCCDVYYVKVVKYPSIAILSIGDELEEPGEILRPQHIYDSNRLILTILLKQKGFNVLDFGITSDNIMSITSKIREILKEANVIVTIGAANDEDLLKPILQDHFNAIIHFGNVWMKPGKSTTYATCIFESTMKHFLCLSKNPAVIPIAAHLFLLPLLDILGCIYEEPSSVVARIQLAPDLHPRPKYVWTALKWKEDTYPWILDMANHYINNPTNALLRLPPCTNDMPKLLSDAFITTILIGSK